MGESRKRVTYRDIENECKLRNVLLVNNKEDIVYNEKDNVKAKEKLFLRCPICGEFYSTSVYSFMRGSKHDSCVKKTKKWNNKKINNLVKSNGFELITVHYNKGGRWKLTLRCENNHVFKVDLDKFMKNPKCIYCNGSKFHESFVRDYIENKNGEKLLSGYTESNSKLTVMCKHGHIYHPTFNNYYNKNTRCPKCAKNVKRTHDEFIEEFNRKNSNHNDIEILGVYTGANNLIRCKCKIDGYEWNVPPARLLSGSGCLKCAIRNNSGENSCHYKPNKTHEERKVERAYPEYKEFIKNTLRHYDYT